DQQEVVVDEPAHVEFFGFASMLEQTPHQTSATAVEDTQCLEVSRGDIATLLQRKPHAGMDMLTVLGRQFHASQQLVRLRAMRNANEVIEKKSTLPERIADSMVQFGGSWTFIIGFIVISSIYTVINIGLHKAAWDPYPFILPNLILSLLAAIQAPVIMMSQNRQDRKDRVRNELDYAVNRRAEDGVIQFVAHAILPVLAVLAHHDDRRLDGCQQGQDEIRQNKRIGIPGCLMQAYIDDGVDAADHDKTNDEGPGSTELDHGVRDALGKRRFLLDHFVGIAH